MKKLLALLLAGLLAIGCLAGCGDDEKKPDSGKESGKQSATQGEKEEDKTSKEEETVEGTPMVLEYDDYVKFDDVKVIVSKDESIIKASNGQIRAVKVTDTPVAVAVHKKDGTVENYAVTVKKAKISIMLICGQSNASGEITGVPENGTKYNCAKLPMGIAYTWGGASSAPTAFVGGDKKDGFRAGLAWEWYETSKAAGAAEKVCFVYQYNYTATPGEKIDEFFDENGGKGTIAKSVKMVNACYEYYKSGKGSENFEIAHCGMYWLQGESDANMDAAVYKAKFKTLWSELKTQTQNKLTYCGILRVRKGGFMGLEEFGPYTAQKALAAEEKDIYSASLITESWSGKNGKTEIKTDISKYHIFNEEQYEGKIAGGILTEQLDSYYGGLHYSPLGYNIIGAESAVNIYNAVK